MKFLDSNGLTYFWNKIKTFIDDNYLSLKGGKIKGIVNVLNKDDTTEYISIDSSSVNNSKYPPHYLFANGKMVPIGEANGVASLDSDGNIPLKQLGNLDTTVAEVVTALPKTNIKKHIYLIKDENGDTQNQYKEYIYTGDTSATYDASKWEKIGDFHATVELADYAKKSKAVANIYNKIDQTHITINYTTIDDVSLGATSIFGSSTSNAGLMIPADKIKLNGIASGATADSAITTAEIDALFV